MRISELGEDIWVAALAQDVRISGPGEHIWAAGLGFGGKWVEDISAG